jgi:hypothetical protein
MAWRSYASVVLPSCGVGHPPPQAFRPDATQNAERADAADVIRGPVHRARRALDAGEQMVCNAIVTSPSR